jgi:HK97 family phage prohead protease
MRTFAEAVKVITADLEQRLLNEKIREAVVVMRRDNERLEYKLLHAQFGDQLRALQRASEEEQRTGGSSEVRRVAEAFRFRLGAHPGVKALYKTMAAPGTRFTFGDTDPTSDVASGMVPMSGYAAVFNIEDLGGDVILPGAFTASLAALEAQRTATGRVFLMPVFASHDAAVPVGGVADAYEDRKGLYVQCYLDPDTPAGQAVISGIRRNYADGMSIGYWSEKTRYGASGTRCLDRINVFEVSLTAIPMQVNAGVEMMRV